MIDTHHTTRRPTTRSTTTSIEHPPHDAHTNSATLVRRDPHNVSYDFQSQLYVPKVTTKATTHPAEVSVRQNLGTLVRRGPCNNGNSAPGGLDKSTGPSMPGIWDSECREFRWDLGFRMPALIAKCQRPPRSRRRLPNRERLRLGTPSSGPHLWERSCPMCGHHWRAAHASKTPHL